MMEENPKLNLNYLLPRDWIELWLEKVKEVLLDT